MGGGGLHRIWVTKETQVERRRSRSVLLDFFTFLSPVPEGWCCLSLAVCRATLRPLPKIMPTLTPEWVP